MRLRTIVKRLRRESTASFRDRGALNIELIGVVPIILIVTILCVQGLMISSLAPAVQQSARDGARAASMGTSVDVAVRRALPQWATLERIEMGAAAQPGCVGHCVRVIVRAPLGLPAITTSNVTIDRATEMPR